MAKKKEEVTVTVRITPMSTPSSNGEVEAMRVKLNEVIDYINER